MYIFANERTAPLLERISFGNGASSFYHLSNEAFHQVADLAGEPPRTIAAHLPEKELCKVERKVARTPQQRRGITATTQAAQTRLELRVTPGVGWTDNENNYHADAIDAVRMLPHHSDHRACRTIP